MAQQDTHPSALAQRVGTLLQAPKTRRLGKWFAIMTLVFGVLGYFAAPPLLKMVLLKQLSAELQREVSIERIDINPYGLSARVGGVVVKAADGHEVFGFDELSVNLSSASFVMFGAVVDEIRLQGLRLAVAHVGDGRYDISDLLDKWMAPSEPSPTPRFSLNNIQLLGGKITFSDQPKGKVHEVSEINLHMPFVSSLPYQADIFVEPKFSATVLGSPLQLNGKSKPFSATHESELNLAIEHFDLAQFRPYLPESLPFRLQGGTVDAELKLVFKETADKVFSLSLAGAAHLSDLVIHEAAGKPLLAWRKLDVELAETDLLNQRFAVQRLALDGLALDVAVNKQGELNWLRLADQMAGQPADNAVAKSEAAPAGKAPVWRLEEFRLSNGLVRWLDESSARRVQGEVRQIELAVGKVDSQMSEPIVLTQAAWQIDLGERLKVEQMTLQDVRIDLSQQRVDIGNVGSKNPRIQMLRTKEGAIDWITPPQLRSTKASSTAKAGEKPWVVNLAKSAVNDLSFRLEDKSVAPAAMHVVDAFNLTLEDLSTEAGKTGKLALKTRINQTGSLSIGGSLQLTPLAAALQVETLAVPLLPLQPYVTDMLNISLTRGQLSSKGEVTVEQGKEDFNARYQGSLTLGDLLTVDKLNNADFLKWKSFYIGHIDFQLQPMALTVGEVALTDFYSRLIVGADGQLNLANIVKKPASTAAVEVKPVATAPAARAPANDKPPMPIKIAKVTLQGGTVNFSDFFVKPNYSANLSKVGGRITGLSSAADSVADMELRGSYANSAPVSVLAKLNPFAAKAYLDLKADVTGVDLVAMSPYSAKFAGYNIDKGKLSLNVAYKLENGQLAADNHLFIDQLTFGSKVDSPTATSLPVNLAIALLKNNRGEIDLNLPIAGSLDDPQFSIGGLVVKVIVNLFVKAVTSPFALLGSMFGGGEELSNIEFAVGRAGFDAAASKKLEALAKAMNSRDSLKLEITGRADPEADKEGLKWVAIERAMRAEKQKDMIKKNSESASIDSISISEAEHLVYLQRAYKEAKFPKPRNMIGLQKDLPREEMEKLMLTYLPATPDDIRQLAIRRAESVQSWLIEQGKVPQGRIFLLPPKLEADEKAKTSRVDFSLR